MNISNTRWLGRQLVNHYYRKPEWEWYRLMATMDASYGKLVMGIRTHNSSAVEIWVRMWCDHFIITPYWIIRQHFCRHPHWVDESYGNPESGGDGGHCPDCHYSFWHTYY